MFEGRKVVCIASGPSLTAEDCERVRASGHSTIVTNTTFRMCPWADVLFAFDAKWWRVYQAEVKATFRGRRYSASILAEKFGARFWYGRRFRSSGACAADFALGHGAASIVLLGYDASFSDGRRHWHDDHPEGLENCGSIADWPRQFEFLAKDAERKKVPIVNASRQTRLTCFPRMWLEDAL